jgi:hypothetical protein
MEVSEPHRIAGEICGFFTWLWVFHRARVDGPVVLGLRHPWEHADDPWAVKDHVDNLEGLRNEWESFSEKASNPGEDDDEEEEEEDGEFSFFCVFNCYLVLIKSNNVHVLIISLLLIKDDDDE